MAADWCSLACPLVQERAAGLQERLGFLALLLGLVTYTASYIAEMGDKKG